MNKIGKIGICAECGYFGSDESSPKARETILAFLAVRGHITTEVQKQKQTYVRVYTMYVTKTDSFTLTKPFADFEEIKKDQVIGMDGSNKVQAQRDSVIVFARNRNQINDERDLVNCDNAGDQIDFLEWIDSSKLHLNSPLQKIKYICDFDGSQTPPPGYWRGSALYFEML